MNTKIGIRELVRNITKIKTAVARGESFEVHDHSTPVFTITPPKGTTQPKYTREDLLTFRVPTTATNLSTRVDEIAYGTKH